MPQNQPSDHDRAHWLKKKVDEAYADPAPGIPVRDVFRRLRTYHAEQAEADTE